MNKLEDFHEDILAKAMRGLGIGKNEIAERLGVQRSSIEAILNSTVNDELIKMMANELGLHGRKLLKAARKEWSPAPVVIDGLKQISSSYGDMIVNTFVVWDEVAGAAWIFDTGTDSDSILQFIDERKFKVDAIFLTHTHWDHITCLDNLRNKAGIPKVYVHQLELFDRCDPITEGFTYSMDSLSLVAKHTHGHSVGGVSYIINGLAKPVAVVGDAIFAGSMGGGIISYKDALRTNREKIMTLPDDTVLCPGHGPLTTVGEEKKNNPFFPEFR